MIPGNLFALGVTVHGLPREMVALTALEIVKCYPDVVVVLGGLCEQEGWTRRL